MSKLTAQSKGPKVLIFDIETAPITAYVWGLWDQNIGLDAIIKDWHVIAWAALWLGDPPSKIMYQDQRNRADVSNDKKILEGIWKLLDEADIVLTKNGKKFDVRKLNTRFLFHKMQKPSSFRHLDIEQVARKHFSFTSNKLEYITEFLNKLYKKLKHTDFPGITLWKECLNGNLNAWKSMEKYNKHDVLSLEEAARPMMAWDTSINLDVYHDGLHQVCSCGSKEFQRYGFAYTSSGKYQRFTCKKCGRESRSKVNLLSKAKRESLRS